MSYITRLLPVYINPATCWKRILQCRSKFFITFYRKLLGRHVQIIKASNFLNCLKESNVCQEKLHLGKYEWNCNCVCNITHLFVLIKFFLTVSSKFWTLFSWPLLSWNILLKSPNINKYGSVGIRNSTR